MAKPEGDIKDLQCSIHAIVHLEMSLGMFR